MLGVPLPAFEQVIHERLRQRESCWKKPAWTAAWEGGRTMTLEHALAYARAERVRDEGGSS